MASPQERHGRRVSLPHLCSRISALAYEDRCRPGLLELGFDLVRSYDRAGSQAILVTNYEIVVLAFRGTEEWRDLFTDLAYIKMDMPGGGRVHQGFLMALLRIWDEIQIDLKDLSYPKVYTGHSLGAAHALMATVLVPPREAHVFGCPRVGNKDFVARLTCPVTRYVNWGDLVPWIPPPISPWQVIHAWRHHRKPTLYVHAGESKRLNGFNHFIHRYVNATAQKS